MITLQRERGCPSARYRTGGSFANTRMPYGLISLGSEHNPMPIHSHIHITGASGSGTTTLAKAIAATHGHRHLDTDDFFWMLTNPPYQHVRPREERLAMLQEALSKSTTWLLSGSLCGWGDVLIARFDLVVFLLLDPEIRIARLREREAKRFGEAAIAPGGVRHNELQKFLDWAAQYDAGGLDMRSRSLHEEWLRLLPCPVLRPDGALPVNEMVVAVESASS